MNRIMVLIILLVLMIWIVLVSTIMSRKLRVNKERKKRKKKTSFIDRLIVESAVTNKLKFYSSLVHILLTIMIFMITYTIAKIFLGNFSSIIFSLLMAILPTISLNIVKQNKVSRTRIEAINFIDIFSNHIISESNIFEAMRESVSLVNDPVREVVELGLEMYDKKLDPLMCIRYIENNLSGVEVKSFFNSLEYHFIEGGDISSINESAIEDLSEIIEIDQSESSEDHAMFFMLYVMVIFDIVVVFLSLLSPYASYITKTVYGEIALSINFALCLSVVVGTLVKEGDTS